MSNKQFSAKSLHARITMLEEKEATPEAADVELIGHEELQREFNEWMASRRSSSATSLGERLAMAQEEFENFKQTPPPKGIVGEDAYAPGGLFWIMQERAIGLLEKECADEEQGA